MSSKKWFKNPEVDRNDSWRHKALDIIQAGLDGIDTEQAIKASISVDGDKLQVKDKIFDLSRFKRIKVIGFGKASCRAAVALESILGSKIESGIILGLSSPVCEHMETFQGTHPRSSALNVKISERISKMAIDSNKDDLVIVIVSGGGSALLCWPQEECDQSSRLYDDSIQIGLPIFELNTVRKHLSFLKGGGLAKLLYPATVVGLIFSDIPSNDYSLVASGPTYKDNSSIKNVQDILEQFGLTGYKLIETPKEDRYFKNVFNIPIVSNRTALEAMQGRAIDFGLDASIISSEIHSEDAATTFDKINIAARPNSVVMAGGEISVKVNDSRNDKCGRNLYFSRYVLDRIQDNEIFISLASDGLDNGQAAGGIVDIYAKQEFQKLCASNDKLVNGDPYDLFQSIGSLIFTGPTEANVSDLMLLIKK